eukprot:XP_001696617.1 granule bound starch synthase [Chlamydomonas reinhardtii]
MQVVFVSTEVAPWSKTGGLGDVVAALPAALALRGHQVMTVSPRYADYPGVFDTGLLAPAAQPTRVTYARLYACQERGVLRVFVDHPVFRAGGGGQGPPPGSGGGGGGRGRDAGRLGGADLQARNSVLCQAALAAPVLLWLDGPEGMPQQLRRTQQLVFVGNDWPTALLPLWLQAYREVAASALYWGAMVVFTVHNFAFQGLFDADSFYRLGLPLIALQQMLLGGSGGVAKAEAEAPPDKLVTVSPGYARELTTPPAPPPPSTEALPPGATTGVMNGLDSEAVWDPATDPLLSPRIRFDAASVAVGKAAAKAELQAVLGLEQDPAAPLFAFVGRLEVQKGVDVVLAALTDLMGQPLEAGALAMLGAAPDTGAGQQWLADGLTALGRAYPRRAVGVVGLDEPLAHLLLAGADFLLVPSRWEPCGLVALAALRYGTLPIVAPTGGLLDAITAPGADLGLVMDRPVGSADDSFAKREAVRSLVRAVQAAQVLYEGGSGANYTALRQRAMAADVSWGGPAARWEQLLLQVAREPPRQGAEGGGGGGGEEEEKLPGSA